MSYSGDLIPHLRGIKDRLERVKFSSGDGAIPMPWDDNKPASDPTYVLTEWDTRVLRQRIDTLYEAMYPRAGSRWQPIPKTENDPEYDAFNVVTELEVAVGYDRDAQPIGNAWLGRNPKEYAEQLGDVIERLALTDATTEESPSVEPVPPTQTEPTSTPTAPEEQPSQRPGLETSGNVFRKRGEVWELQFKGKPDKPTTLIHRRGLEYIYLLLRDSSGPISAIALSQQVNKPDIPDRVTAPEPSTNYQATSGVPVIDAEARAKYEKDLREIDLAIAKAQENHDEAEIDRLMGDKDFLLKEVKSATGLGGQTRKTKTPLQKAGDAVTSAIRNAYRNIRKNPDLHHLAKHLEQYISTGSRLRYEPPDTVDWDL